MGLLFLLIVRVDVQRFSSAVSIRC
uniref:Uncharacterized protein n=1 Tax=mine drainage metagenome TaxID=410659 RepID=E6QNU2_9ZZZZ